MNVKELLVPKSQSEIENAIRNLSPDDKLNQCASGGYFPGVKQALSEGANINYREGEGTESPLELAVNGHHYELVTFLVKENAAVDHCEIFKRILTEYDHDVKYQYFKLLYEGNLQYLDLDYILSYVGREGKAELLSMLPMLNLKERK